MTAVLYGMSSRLLPMATQVLQVNYRFLVCLKFQPSKEETAEISHY